MSMVGYSILEFDPHMVFIVSFSLHVYILFLQLIQPKCIKVTDISKLLFFKTIATSYNLDSGRKNKLRQKNKKNHDVNDLHEKPTFFEWVAYCFTPFGCSSIVFYEFRVFKYLLKPDKSYVKDNVENQRKALNCFKRSIAYALIYAPIHNFLKIRILQSHFCTSLNFIFQIIFVWIITILFLFKRFFQFKAIDAGLYQEGVYDIVFPDPSDFEVLFTQKTIKDWSRALNPTFHSFYTKYFSSHLSDPRFSLNSKSKIVIKLINKPLSKGFHGAEFISTLQKKFLFFIEKRFHFIISKSIKSKIPFLLFTQLLMISNRAIKSFKTTQSFFLVSFRLHFFIEIVSAAIIFASSLFLEVRNEKDKHE